ncbi:hypothetical protein [Brucella thiophenivorans]|uniref:Uncharacterized protein n=1 Tax=Brucella thiophenivorans TaxID=571255 RepID=A0A256FRW2_9HYPH|nr:hypothetical protein [Brucella thiophenivorans]OYR17605.1 hypothetical protein CEV31_4332 [Brucella thiophenivorans]
MRKTALPLAFACVLLLSGAANSQEQNNLSFLQYEPNLEISFDGTDPEATQIARKMYGKEFRHVDAKRMWLKDPDDGNEQLAVRLSKNKKCKDDCVYAVLFHDDDQWLELWRGKAKKLEFGPIGANGMRGIYDGSRMWVWTGDNYWPHLTEYKFDYQKISSEAKNTLDTALEKEFGEKRDDTQYFALPLALSSGAGSIVSMSSSFYCGQFDCPVFIIDANSNLLARYGSLESQAGASKIRDTNNNPLIETVTTEGIATYQIGEPDPKFIISPQSPIIAGKARK